MPETPNHSYNVPNEGAQDWHVPLNENFRQYDTDIELRGPQGDLTTNTPTEGAKYLATDTGRIYVGDGNQWVETLALPRLSAPTIAGNAGSVVLGSSANTADADGAVVAGGGSAGGVSSQPAPNEVTGPFGVISGGAANRVTAEEGVIGGGELNRATGDYATVAGGSSNQASEIGATVGGGGGVGSQSGNFADSAYATVAGGSTNTVGGQYGTVAGGWANRVLAAYGTIAGGGPSDPSNTDTGNVVYDEYGTVAGGAKNQAGSDDGQPDSASFATVGGGSDNRAAATAATVAGGIGNRATVAGAAVGGGTVNVASGIGATIPGGANSEASGDNTLAAGREAKARAAGAFVWGDSSATAVESTTADEVVFQAGGGVTLWSDSGFNSGVQLAAGSGTWSQLSSRTAKSNVTSVDPPAVLDRVRDLDVSTWEYDTEDGVTHMGPMAEDFADAFDLGADDDHIANVDADGVALAAIKGLSQELDDAREDLAAKDERIEDQRERIDGLEAENEALRDRLAAVEDHLDIGPDEDTGASADTDGE